MTRTLLGTGCALLIATISVQGALTVINDYDADPDNDLLTAAPSPGTQGWTVDSSALQSSAPDNTGWRINDTSSSATPAFRGSVTTADFANMYDDGWEMTATVRFNSGGGFFGWGITSANDPGWGLATRERVAFNFTDVGGNLEIRHLGTAGGHALVASVTGGVSSYVDIRVVGEAASQNFEVFVNDASAYSSTISAGSSNSSSDNRISASSGSGSGTGRQHDWAEISLSYGVIPEPATGLLLGLGGFLLGRRRRSAR